MKKGLVISEHIKKILQEVGEDAGKLEKKFSEEFKKFRGIEDNKQRQDGILSLQDYLPLFSLEQLGRVKQLVQLSDIYGLTLLSVDQNKKKGSIKKLGDFASPSNDEGESSYSALMRAITEAETVLKKEQGLMELQGLYKNQ